MNEIKIKTSSFVEQIKQLLRDAQSGVVRSVNAIMVQTYYESGRRIVEQKQDGKEQSNYGEYLIDRLSTELINEFGKGYSKRNLELIRKFCNTYRIAKSPISQSISQTHYLQLMPIHYAVPGFAGRKLVFSKGHLTHLIDATKLI